MLENAKEKRQATIAKSVKIIKNDIDEAVNKGKHKITAYSQFQYMGSEVVNILKEAGYNVREERASRPGESTYTISW